ncbi:MAG: J domain-containing protein [Limisphaerales bacterium]
MDSASIAAWLKKKSRIEAVLDIVVGLFLIVCSGVILALTWAAGFVITLLLQLSVLGLIDDSGRYNAAINYIGATVFLVVIFLAHFRRERELLGTFPELQYIAGRASFFPRAVAMSVYTAGEVFSKIIADFLLIGPRLLGFTGSLFWRALRLCRLDYWRCAQILEALLRKGRRISFVELEQVVPDANRFHVFDQLKDIDGVVFLLSEPAGVSLVQDLRTELRNVPLNAFPSARSNPIPEASSIPRFEFHPPNAPPKIELPTDLEECLRLLGISAGASSEEVRDAYRRKIKECHPDRFLRFGKDWQRLAEDRSKQINRAYEIVLNQRFDR